MTAGSVRGGSTPSADAGGAEGERSPHERALVAALRDADERLALLQSLFDNMAIGTAILDASLNVISANAVFCKFCGRTETEMIGKAPPFHADLFAVIKPGPNPETILKQTGSLTGEATIVGTDETRRALEIALTRLPGSNGIDVRYGGIVRDVTARREKEEQIRKQANFDNLTGLPNRSLFMDRLNQSLATMARLNAKLGLMFIDLDGFKLVNDTLGHERGDELLREAGRRIAECVRGQDTVARLGGDEFTVIMPNLQYAHDAPIVAQRILQSLAQPFILDGNESFVSGSIGITVYPDDAAVPGDLLRNADAAMYRAKEKGKANFQFYTADLNEEISERLALRNGLVKGLERGEFKLSYQPKLNLATGRIDGVEALMRWQSDDLGTVSPSRFIPVMEETGMVVEVGLWAIETACRQHRAWIDAGLPPLRIAVNLSARQLREISFVKVLKAVLERTGVGPEGLEIEITESMLMSDTESAITALKALHELGIHVAMDDFGTGYSSLSYLRNFPIDTIKIDREFINDMTASTDGATIIRTIIGMGRALNKSIVAEGVETAAQLEMLRDFTCDHVQGYFVSAPKPGDDLIGFLREHTA